MTEMIDRTDVSTYRTATMEEKNEANVPDHLWMGVSVDGRVPNNVVGVGVFTDMRKDWREAALKIADADDWIRTFAKEHNLTDDQDPVLISLSQVNELLRLLGRDKIATAKEFTFTATITYEINGSVFCKDEETARELIDELIYAMSDPDIIEPTLDGDDEEWYKTGVEYSDHDITDVSEA